MVFSDQYRLKDVQFLKNCNEINNLFKLFWESPAFLEKVFIKFDRGKVTIFHVLHIATLQYFDQLSAV